jgi:hypothetical protein
MTDGRRFRPVSVSSSRHVVPRITMQVKTLRHERFQFSTGASQFGNAPIREDVLKGLPLEVGLQQLA